MEKSYAEECCSKDFQLIRDLERCCIEIGNCHILKIILKL